MRPPRESYAEVVCSDVPRTADRVGGVQVSVGGVHSLACTATMMFCASVCGFELLDERFLTDGWDARVLPQAAAWLALGQDALHSRGGGSCRSRALRSSARNLQPRRMCAIVVQFVCPFGSKNAST